MTIIAFFSVLFIKTHLACSQSSLWFNAVTKEVSELLTGSFVFPPAKNKGAVFTNEGAVKINQGRSNES